jgi:hypothetical protein
MLRLPSSCFAVRYLPGVAALLASVTVMPREMSPITAASRFAASSAVIAPPQSPPSRKLACPCVRSHASAASVSST